MSIQLKYSLNQEMKHIKENLINIKPSATLAINELSKKLESEGQKIYKFGLGQSPFPIPDTIRLNQIASVPLATPIASVVPI